MMQNFLAFRLQRQSYHPIKMLARLKAAAAALPLLLVAFMEEREQDTTAASLLLGLVSVVCCFTTTRNVRQSCVLSVADEILTGSNRVPAARFSSTNHS